MIERFSKEQFEYALPKSKLDGKKLWISKGLESGEETYDIPVRVGVKIVVRSSVGSEGVAHETGTDSIRCWLCRTDGSPMGSKIQSHVSRVCGWQDRMLIVIRELWKRALAAGDCPNCGKPFSIFETKKPGKNKGRLFVKCGDCESYKTFRWLDEEISQDFGKCKYAKMGTVGDGVVEEKLREIKFKKDKVQMLRNFLGTEEDWCLWALNRIFNKQTEDEQRYGHTTHLNKVGFSGVDAEILTSFAKQFKDRGSLSSKQIDLVKKKMPKYSGQLLSLMGT